MGGSLLARGSNLVRKVRKRITRRCSRTPKASRLLCNSLRSFYCTKAAPLLAPLNLALDRMGTTEIIGWTLVAASIAAGLYYSALGIAALRHLPTATQMDRVFGWTSWWFLEQARYDEEGKRLCRRGRVVFAVAWALAVPGYYLLIRR